MKISKEYKKTIIDEFEKVIKLISESKTLQDELYYFSAMFGIINHIMNLEMNSTLVAIHQILKEAHTAFSQRLNQPKLPNVESLEFPKQVWQSLKNILPTLVVSIKDNDDEKLRVLLEKIIYHSYANSGNGFYNLKKGTMVFD